MRTGVFADKAKRRLTDQITANVPALVGKPTARRTLKIRAALAGDAGAWLATEIAGDTRGAVIDDLAEATSNALASSRARWRLGDAHLICEVYAQMYLLRTEIEKAVAAGLGVLTDRLTEIIAESVDDTTSAAAATGAAFVDALEDELTGILGRRLVTVVLAHFCYPTPAQLAALIMLSCPDPSPHGHPAAAHAILEAGIPAIIDSASLHP